MEFAIVAGAFFCLLLLTIEVAWQMAGEAALYYGGLSAARYGITGQGTSAQRNGLILGKVISATGGFLSAQYLTLAMSSYGSLGGVGSGQGTTGGGTGGQFVQYALTYQQPLLTPIAAAILGATKFAHRMTIVVQNEPF